MRYLRKAGYVHMQAREHGAGAVGVSKASGKLRIDDGRVSKQGSKGKNACANTTGRERVNSG